MPIFTAKNWKRRRGRSRKRQSGVKNCKHLFKILLTLHQKVPLFSARFLLLLFHLPLAFKSDYENEKKKEIIKKFNLKKVQSRSAEQLVYACSNLEVFKRTFYFGQVKGLEGIKKMMRTEKHAKST